MKMYRTKSYSNRIEEVEIVRSTEKSVWVTREDIFGEKNKIRCLKMSDYEKYWDTYKEAKQYLIKRYENVIESLKKRLQEARSELGQVK